MKARRLLWFGMGLGLLLAAVLLVTPGRTLDFLGVPLPMVFKGYLPFPLGFDRRLDSGCSQHPHHRLYRRGCHSIPRQRHQQWRATG